MPKVSISSQLHDAETDRTETEVVTSTNVVGREKIQSHITELKKQANKKNSSLCSTLTCTYVHPQSPQYPQPPHLLPHYSMSSAVRSSLPESRDISLTTS